MAADEQRPAWANALAPYLVELTRVPLKSPIRTLLGALIPEVPGAVLRLPRWTGADFVDDFGRKGSASVELDGEHVFAELALLRLLERAGWEGRWVNTKGTKHGEIWKLLTRWSDVPREEQRHRPIEDERPRQLLTSIANANKPARWAGCWDVYAWRGEEFAFLQCKKGSPARERLGAQQEEWLRMALLTQPALVKLDSFCFVLWDYQDS